ncbi:efflux RND transporter periplasmic adaptor subunit [Mariniblastus fucicola]|uniref:HlyD family secretion protein n=1 Tax=Mariniblastus fucicola TaxID=980251 RepID=A0A5B9P9D2_9BACT|nr:efflux RND transporter periplasmic adaptor subunit [Mariniblastus fucicola]QEG23347.1 HlyD family secretion protein [Mariniblastus fucicola]
MRSNIYKFWQPLVWLTVIIGLAAGAWLTRGQWRPLIVATESSEHDHPTPAPNEERKTLELNSQARANLGLKSKPVSVQTYWRSIEIPGVIVDRPGVTDRGITSPLEGVVTQVYAFEGDVVRPGDKLFRLRMVSDSLQQAQSELFKAVRETEIVRMEISRVSKLIDSGVLPGKRMIELDQKLKRQSALIDAHQQDLIARGLDETQIEQIKQGDFLTSIEIFAPPMNESNSALSSDNSLTANGSDSEDFFEIQQLKVDLGHQVESGKPLAILANHRSLYIKGHAFKKEASKLAKAAEKSWEVDVEFTEDNAEDWSPLQQTFQIRHLANTTDPDSRTFDFFISLNNQSIVYERDDRPFIVWRFRPGQRVRISVPVEEIKNVIVLPSTAVYQDGPEAFVFQQNGDLFNQISVKVLHRDRSNVVIANDGSVSPGFYLAQNAAASLNRILKAQASSGSTPAGYHVHADGSVHGAH